MEKQKEQIVEAIDHAKRIWLDCQKTSMIIRSWDSRR